MTSKSLCCLVLLTLWFRTRPLAAQQQRPPDVTDPGQVPNILYFNTANTSENSRLQQNFDTIFEFLVRATPPIGFATCLGYGNFPDTAFGHSGCYNMSDQAGCSNCVEQAFRTARRTNTIGARVWTNTTSSRCSIQYEIDNFTNGLPPETLGVLGPNASASTPPAQAPPAVAPPPAIQGGSSSSSSTGVIVGVAVGAVVLLVLGVLAFLLIRRRRLRRWHVGNDLLDELQGSSRGPVSFLYQDLSTATNNFHERNLLGQGGFGPVHKAVLGDGTPLALKKLSVGSHQGKREFVNEINIITGIQHKNLVKLIGYCVEGDNRILAYEFLDNSSLDRALFGNRGCLNWQDRFQIIVGVAKGLAYLHEESHIQIIHRDIKASNILLDKSLQPKISDFGISKLAGLDNNTTTRVAGTVGYMAPEYALQGRLSTNADVFSFGVLVLEIISGRKCMDPMQPTQENLLQQAWNLVGAGRLEEFVDPKLGKDFVLEEAYKAANIALLCIRDFEDGRPKMSAVVAMLMGYMEVEQVSGMETPSYFVENRQRGSSSAGTTSSSSEWTGSSVVVPR